VILRLGQPDDREAVLDIHRCAFSDPGSGDHGSVVAGLVEALYRDDPHALSVVAEVGGQAVGHVMFSRSLLDAPPRLVPVQVLSPLAVRPEHQAHGVGAALIRCGVEHLDRGGVPLVFLEGDPGYYSRHGFVAGDGVGFRKPSLRIPDAAFQVMMLSAYEPWMTGTLVYSSTFWDHDCVGLREPT
jgi:putative acetyltransferase